MLDDALANTFARLCLHDAYICRVCLHQPDSLLRGLRTTEPTAAGEPVLAVPWELVISSQVSQALPWHRIAEHHFEIAASLLDKRQSDLFWAQYADLLPPLTELPHPATLPASHLELLEDTALSEEANRARAYVGQHYYRQCSEASDAPACDERHWAVALARSRPRTRHSRPPAGRRIG